jgi:hypothetical protein
VTLLENYKFHFDRIRMISKELRMQNYTEGGNVSSACIEIVEHMCRYWVAFQHRLNSDGDFVSNHGKQNTDRLTDALTTLMHFYTYCKRVQLPQLCRNEPEFLAYMLLVVRDVPDTLKHLTPSDPVLRSPEVQFALQVLYTMDRTGGNYHRFFRLYAAAPYLAACCMAKYAQSMRRTAVDVIDKAYYTRGPACYVPLEWLRSMLCFASVEELGEWLEHDDPTPPTTIHVHNGVAQWALTGGRAKERERKKVAEDLFIRENAESASGRQARAARTLENSYPFDPFIEVKAERVPFKSLVRGKSGALSVRLSPQLAGAWTPLLRGFTQQQQQPAPSLQSLARLPLPAPVSTSPRVDRSAPVLSPPPEEKPSRPLVPPAAEGPADLTEEQKAEADRAAEAERQRRREEERAEDERNRQVRARHDVWARGVCAWLTFPCLCWCGVCSKRRGRRRRARAGGRRRRPSARSGKRPAPCCSATSCSPPSAGRFLCARHAVWSAA